MADLRDNNLELQEQLQDAQDNLEALMANKPHRTVSEPSRSSALSSFLEEGNLLGGKMTISHLLFAGEEEFQAVVKSLDVRLQQQLVEARQSVKRASEAGQAVPDKARGDNNQEELILARQHVNRLEVENEELRRTIARQRYEHHPGNSPTAPPPPPIAPPPLACPSRGDLDNLLVENSRLKTQLLQLQETASSEVRTAPVKSSSTLSGIRDKSKSKVTLLLHDFCSFFSLNFEIAELQDSIIKNV